MAIDFPSSPATYQLYKASNFVIYQWDGEKWNSRMRPGHLWNPGDGCVCAPSPPANPSVGMFWFDTTDGRLYVWFEDGGGSYQWTDVSGYIDNTPERGNRNTIGPVAPSDPWPGDLWFNTKDGRLYIYYNDGDSKQWTDISYGINSGPPVAPPVMPPPMVHVGPNPPQNPAEGKLWFDTTRGRMSVYYDDGNTTQWVDVSYFNNP